MNKQQREQIMRDAIQRYTVPHQMAKIVEESGELGAAVAMHLACPDETTRLALLDECADMQIMIDELRLMSSYVDANLEARIEYKLERLWTSWLRRLCNAQYNSSCRYGHD